MPKIDVPYAPSRSLRVRLPLVLAACIAISVGACLAVAYQQVVRTLVRAGEARAQVAAAELSSLLAQSAQQRLAEVRRVAADPAVIDYLRRRDAASADLARRKLGALTAVNQPPAELWAGSERVLTASNGGARPAVEPTAPRAAPGVARFMTEGSAVLWTVAAPVPRDGQGAEFPDAIVVNRRTLTGASSSDAIARLVGAGAIIRLANEGDGVSADLSGRLQPAGGNDLVSAAATVRGTPWVVRVGFPRRLVLAPAASFLAGMVAVAGVLVLAATFAVYRLTAQLTAPLHELTRAADSIAAGDLERSVAVARQDEVGRLAVAFNLMAKEIRASHRDLEARIEARTRDITALNRELEQHVAQLKALTGELEAFSYSVSHDLRAPLRHIAGFASLLSQRAGDRLDADSQRYIRVISDAAAQMGRLVDDLLSFSRMSRVEMQTMSVDLTSIVQDAAREAEEQANGRTIRWTVHPLPTVTGDARMLRVAFMNLLSNAVKYTATREVAEIEIGANRRNGEHIVYVRDNGVGFDMQYVNKLFGVFQRLHNADDFEGTGIGLANVRRVLQRHGGRAWAEGAVDRGATFFVALPA